MSASDESDAEMSRINGTRNRKLRITRHACTARWPARGRRYRPSRSCGTRAACSTADGLEESTRRLGAAHHPVRKQHEEETDHRLERAGSGSHAYVSDGGQCAVHVRVDDVSRGEKLGGVTGNLVEESESGVEIPANRENKVVVNKGPGKGRGYVHDLLPGTRSAKAAAHVDLGV